MKKATCEITRVSPCYTGGNVYVYTGGLSDGTYFLSDDGFYDVMILNNDPHDEYDDAFCPEWQESHLVRYLTHDEALDFFTAMYTWIFEHKPNDAFCNYEMSDLQRRLDEVQVLKTQDNWR